MADKSRRSHHKIDFFVYIGAIILMALAHVYLNWRAIRDLIGVWFDSIPPTDVYIPHPEQSIPNSIFCNYYPLRWIMLLLVVGLLFGSPLGIVYLARFKKEYHLLFFWAKLLCIGAVIAVFLLPFPGTVLIVLDEFTYCK